MDWSNQGTCFYLLDEVNNKKPFIGFDYDDTLCEKYTSNILDNVEYKLKELIKNFNICIFTNQMGISKERTTHEKVRNILMDFKKKIGIPMQIFYSTEDDEYRKPMRGMYDLLFKLFEKVKMEYYCGDAAGRMGDFSIGDLYFANNCNLIFRTPEEIFQDKENPTNLFSKKKKALELYQKDIWDLGKLQNPRNILEINTLNSIKDKLIFRSKKNLIILVGPQASGKSSITKYLVDNYKLGIINGDTQKTKSKMNKAFKEYQSDKNLDGIIIDNTNPTKKTRKEWIDKLIDVKTWEIKIIFINITKLEAFHLTKYRMFYGGVKIPTIAINIYYKNLDIPSEDEGDLIKINNAITNKKFNQNLRFI